MDWGHTSSHNSGKSIVAAEEQIALEDVNHLDDEEKDNETKEGVTDDLNQFLYPKYSENSKVGESCVLCGFASSATKKVTFSRPWRGTWKESMEEGRLLRGAVEKILKLVKLQSSPKGWHNISNPKIYFQLA